MPALVATPVPKRLRLKSMAILSCDIDRPDHTPDHPPPTRHVEPCRRRRGREGTRGGRRCPAPGDAKGRRRFYAIDLIQVSLVGRARPAPFSKRSTLPRCWGGHAWVASHGGVVRRVVRWWSGRTILQATSNEPDQQEGDGGARRGGRRCTTQRATWTEVDEGAETRGRDHGSGRNVQSRTERAEGTEVDERVDGRCIPCRRLTLRSVRAAARDGVERGPVDGARSSAPQGNSSREEKMSSSSRCCGR